MIVHELRDIEALNQLVARYCHLVDARQWKDLAQLFTEDATCEYGFLGSFNGRNEIMTKFFEPLAQDHSFMAHMVHNPIVEVQDDVASGSWYLTAQITLEPMKQAVWVMAKRQHRFKRVDGSWKFTAIKVEPWYFSRYEQGWAKICRGLAAGGTGHPICGGIATVQTRGSSGCASWLWALTGSLRPVRYYF